MQYKKPKVTLLHSSPLAIGEIASRICYDSFELSENSIVKDFRDSPEGIAKRLDSGEDINDSKLLDKLINVYFHGSVAESITFQFHIKDVARNVHIEMLTHRAGVSRVNKSTRYTIEDLVEAWLVYYEDVNKYTYSKFMEVIKNNVILEDDKMLTSLTNYLYESLAIINIEEPLRSGLTGGAKKKQNDRIKPILPESWMIEGIWTFNLRSLKHFIELRSANSAYWGIREVTKEIQEAIPHKYRILIDKKYRKEYNK